ncbi:hypothetical protein LIER_40420 [Lithospermum erythrorhizon]|uniref:RRM domain-containing protein n=1 Tax=Lithospermum erythrorhizon TaxID=34254 RepID=A0AAV3QXH6_LITER
MSSSEFKLDDNAPTVSWADPRNTESSTSSQVQVKAVYVKNLPKDVTEEKLKKLFEHHGKITKVVVPPAKRGQENSRFGFIHFAERSSAMKALKNTEKYDMDGQELQCSLAKPQADQKPSSGTNLQRTPMYPSYQPPLGYGLVGPSYGAIGAGYGAAGFGHPMVYGRGAAAGGLSMMPMLLPDGRIGYVLQQPGAQPHTPPPQQRGERSADRGSSSGGRRSSDSGRGRGRGRGRGSRYNPY